MRYIKLEMHESIISCLMLQTLYNMVLHVECIQDSCLRIHKVCMHCICTIDVYIFYLHGKTNKTLKKGFYKSVSYVSFKIKILDNDHINHFKND